MLQVDCELVKIDIHCHIQGDVVFECISLDNDLEREEMVFRVMFNTAFIRSNILMLNRDDIDILWHAKDQFPKDFRAEVCSITIFVSSPSSLSSFFYYYYLFLVFIFSRLKKLCLDEGSFLRDGC